jgi:CHAD domain-containing protein
LREAGSLVGTEDGQAVRDELKWLGGQLGPARDLDVLVTRLRRQVAELDGPDAVPAEKIVAQLVSDRQDAQAELLAALESPRYAALLGALERLVAAPPVATSEVSLPNVARREYRKLERQIERLGPTPSNDALHSARIQAKRMRYATELSAPLLGKDGRRLVEEAKKLQDVVGAHQDAVVAEMQIRNAVRRARGVGTAVAAGRLIERERQRRVAAREALPDAWRRVRRSARAIWA